MKTRTCYLAWLAVTMPGVALWACAALAAEDEAHTASPAYDTFNILVERNIFSPSRRPNASKQDEAPPPTPYQPRTMRLMGTVLTPNVKLALFEGDSEAPRNGGKPGDTLVGYTIVDVKTDGITLKGDSGTFDVAVGSGLSQLEDGTWVAADASVVRASAPSTSTDTGGGASAPASNASSSSESSGAAPEASGNGGPSAAPNDALERLRQRRRQELGQ